MMKAKILWAEADRIHKMLTKDLKEGKLNLSKKAKIDVDKVPHSVIEYQDRNALMMALGAGAIIGFLGMMMVGDLTTGLIIMLAAILVPLRLAMAKKIIFPFFFAKWKSCTPFDMLKAKPTNVFYVKQEIEEKNIPKTKDGKFKLPWKADKKNKIKEGFLEFYSVKMQEPTTLDETGIPMFSPESYALMDKNTAVKEIIRGEHEQKTNMALMIIMLILGVMIGYMIAPLIAQALAPAVATPPTV